MDTRNGLMLLLPHPSTELSHPSKSPLLMQRATLAVPDIAADAGGAGAVICVVRALQFGNDGFALKKTLTKNNNFLD
ncbi:hypothetical protein IWW45_006280 [Coemansia sp. RSA 485]|nr:hypothetical protein IWW45_006280 [Coemansia sp. RSA 485]